MGVERIDLNDRFSGIVPVKFGQDTLNIRGKYLNIITQQIFK